MIIDVLGRDYLPFPKSLPEFQRLFPDEVACAAYLEPPRWGNGFVCPYCGMTGEPYRYTSQPWRSLLQEMPT
jgi:Transposase zinc-ribbon domain